jgi:hypothetical protein
MKYKEGDKLLCVSADMYYEVDRIYTILYYRKETGFEHENIMFYESPIPYITMLDGFLFVPLTNLTKLLYLD